MCSKMGMEAYLHTRTPIWTVLVEQESINEYSPPIIRTRELFSFHMSTLSRCLWLCWLHRCIVVISWCGGSLLRGSCMREPFRLRQTSALFLVTCLSEDWNANLVQVASYSRLTSHVYIIIGNALAWLFIVIWYHGNNHSFFHNLLLYRIITMFTGLITVWW